MRYIELASLHISLTIILLLIQMSFILGLGWPFVDECLKSVLLSLQVVCRGEGTAAGHIIV